jgi:hypothetical protein
LAENGNARRQAALGIGRLALIYLCLLCSVKLHLELVAQYIKPALGLQITNVSEQESVRVNVQRTGDQRTVSSM